MLRRLHLQIYLTIIASLVLVVAITAVLWGVLGRDRLDRQALDIAGRLASLSLPEAGAPPDEQRQAVRRLSRELDVDVTLFDAERRLVGAAGPPARVPGSDVSPGHWQRGHRPHHWIYGLPDGRWLVVDVGRRRPGHPLLNLVLFVGAVAAGVGLGAYPLVRRLTRRLERLQQGVERIGSGELGTRVEVEGRDEVARLATSFNEAAEKIERLVEAHRMLLANASHELRTPLSRIRLGLEMLNPGGDTRRRAALEQDIAELDALIDEILLMSRLDTGAETGPMAPVDLLALAAEECARYPDCEVSGQAGDIDGDARLLRRMIRNLIDNAHKHGAPPVAVSVADVDDRVTLTVSDSGTGIAEADRERAFRPFYRAAGRQNVRGYGLGLPLVRQIAELHGGTAEFLDPAVAGSSVRVVLPRRAAVDAAG